MRQFGRFGPLVGAIDEGTSSARFMVFAAKTSEILTYHQVSINRFSPQEDWVEQDPLEILNAVLECIEVTVDNLRKLDINPEDIVSVGITNQRETTILWNSVTGQPLYSAIVWLDGRTAKTVDDLLDLHGVASANAVTRVSGLPLSTYFSSVKIRWLLQHVPAVKEAVNAGRCLAGTVDSWLIWNLTGGRAGGVHTTDVSNASRTQLMSLRTLQWDKRLLKYFHVPVQILPKIRSSSEIYGYISSGSLTGVPIAGCLGDQQAALVGQGCLRFGQAKCTYGTGCFLLYNTGDSIVHSQHGLLATVAYKLGPSTPVVYALEGSVAVAGGALQWLQDGAGVLEDVREAESLADAANDAGEVCFVPAFTGLYAPYWRKDARGVICGMTERTEPAHMARAALEAVCQQVRAVTDAMAADCGPLKRLLVDGGMTTNSLLMQMQSDICGIPIIRPLMSESTALGAAAAAGRALGVWPPSSLSIPADTFTPNITQDEREMRTARWRMGVERSLGWAPDTNKRNSKSDEEDDNKAVTAVPPSLFVLGTALLVLVASKFAGKSPL